MNIIIWAKILLLSDIIRISLSKVLNFGFWGSSRNEVSSEDDEEGGNGFVEGKMILLHKDSSRGSNDGLEIHIDADGGSREALHTEGKEEERKDGREENDKGKYTDDACAW